MATAHQSHFFDDGDAMLFGDADIFGGGVTCIAGELELQVQTYEGDGDLSGGHSAGKSFPMTKDSGGSTLSALAAVDFGDADFMDNVSLDALAAADHYGHTICGRQSTADSGAIAVAASSGRDAFAGAGWDITAAPDVRAPGTGMAETQLPGTALSTHEQLQSHQKPEKSQQQQQQQQQHYGHESSDCDTSHTIGDGESSGVGPGKGVAVGSSHSEASEDNTAGFPACRDEEHVSMPSYGLSLSRLTHISVPPQSQAAQYPTAAAATGGQDKTQQRQQQQQAAMTRAFSVDTFPLSGRTSAALPEPPASQADAQPRGHVMRSFSCIGSDTLPMEFSLGCGDSGMPMSFGARGRCASLNETQLRRHWLHEGEFLAPQLPPSVSELELLELPEDSIPVRPSKCCSLLDMQQQQQEAGAGCQVGSSYAGLTQINEGSSSAAGATVSGPGTSTAVTVKRKIITSPSPLLSQPRQTKARQAAAAAAAGSLEPSGKIQSPKRARVASAVWQPDGGSAATTTTLGNDWHASRAAGAGSAPGGMKTVRSMPANMNSFFDGVEVTVQPLGMPGQAEVVISPNSSSVSACAAQQPFGRGPFFDGSSTSGGVASGRGAAVPQAAGPQVPAPRAAKTRGAAAAAAQGPSVVTVMPMPVMPGAPGVPCTFPMPGMVVGPDGKRMGPVPSVPKPRKRASPNGNPPKAPAPNPNGHCCTQCGTQTTPVWRAGPHGPKTLCNACGVRYMKVAKGNVAPTPRRQQH